MLALGIASSGHEMCKTGKIEAIVEARATPCPGLEHEGKSLTPPHRARACRRETRIFERMKVPQARLDPSFEIGRTTRISPGTSIGGLPAEPLPGKSRAAASFEPSIVLRSPPIRNVGPVAHEHERSPKRAAAPFPPIGELRSSEKVGCSCLDAHQKRGSSASSKSM